MEANGDGLSSGAASTQRKPIKCRAAVAWGPGEPLAMEEVEVAPPGRMEVRIKVLFTSICHTDLSAWKGENELQRKFPRIFGHEAAGVVESVGEGVEDLAPGDHVVPIFTGECGACAYCESSKTNLCGTYRVNPFKSTMVSDGGTRFSVVDRSGVRQPVYHFLNTSTFAEYTVLDSACAVKITPSAPLKKMCLLSCCISTGVGAAWNTANVSKGSTVAVFGLGAVGLAVAEGARLRGAARIIGVDINPEKLTKGKEMGITDFINSKACGKPVHEVIREMTDGGVDYSFECTGVLDVLREAFVSTHDVCAHTHSLSLSLSLSLSSWAGRRPIWSANTEWAPTPWAGPLGPTKLNTLSSHASYNELSLCVHYATHAGLGPDSGAGDPSDAQDAAAAPDGALRRPSDHRLRLRRLQGQVAAASPRGQVHAGGG